MNDGVAQRIRAVFADAGCTGRLHARRCTGPEGEISIGGTERVVTASVYKLLVFVAYCRLVDEGVLDPAARRTVDPTACTPGPTGLAALCDPVTLSLRDLALSMMTVSDNAAADILLDLVGLDRVTALAAECGLTATRVVGGMAQVHESLVRETDSHTTAEAFAALAGNEEAHTVSAYDPAYASATTPEEMTRFLRAVWTGSVLSPERTATVRAVMSAQVWRHRIAAGFPYPCVRVAGKTGTIGAIRNEVAVVEFPDEHPVAVAVFTRAARADPHLAVVDAAIGETARLAVTELRRPLD